VWGIARQAGHQNFITSGTTPTPADPGNGAGASLTRNQRERDEERLASLKVTLREKRQIRTARARADAPQVRKEKTTHPTSLLCGELEISTLD
jgi:hypothetical protein